MKFFLDTVNGSDTNTGLLETAPWQTPAKVKEALGDGTISYGDELRIACGSTIPEPVFTSSFPVTTRRTGEKLIFGSYGAGDKPIFDGYKYANQPEFWTEVTTNIWEIDLTPNNGTHTGNVTAPGNNIGHLYVDGVFHEFEKTSADELLNQWDYYSHRTDPILRVYSVGNPADDTESLAIAVYQNGASPRHDTIMEGFRIQGFGLTGINVRLATSKVQNMDIRSCDFVNIGGSHLPAVGGPRLGNGVQVWTGAENINVHDCYFHQIYDVAVTCQGDVDTNQAGWLNIDFNGNVISHCGQAVEFWARQDTGFGFRNVRFRNNEVSASGFGWGYDARPDKNKGVDILTYALLMPTDISIENNRFIGARDGYCYHNDATGSYEFPQGIRRSGNTIAGYDGTFVQYDEGTDFRDWDAWVAATGSEKGSTFHTILPGSDIGSKMSNTEVVAAAGAARVGYQPPVADTHRANTTPTYQTGRWYTTPRTADNTLTFNTQNTGAGKPFVAAFDGILDGAGVIVTAGASGGSVRFAVYEESISGVWYRIGNLGAASASAAGGCQVILGSGGVRIRKGVRYVVLASIIGAAVALRATDLPDPLISGNTLTNLDSGRFAGHTLAGVTGDNYPTSINAPMTGASPVPILSLHFK